MVKKVKKKKEMNLEDYFKKSGNSLVALSIFLLITFQLKLIEFAFSKSLALLSACIAFIILIHMTEDFGSDSSILLNVFMTIFFFFSLIFAFWVIFNLIAPFEGYQDWLMFSLWVSGIVTLYVRRARQK